VQVSGKKICNHISKIIGQAWRYSAEPGEPKVWFQKHESCCMIIKTCRFRKIINF